MNDEEEIEVAREQFEDEDLDTKILHLLVTMIGLAQVLIAHQYLKLKDYIEYPIRRPITRIGYDYIHNVLREDPQHFRQLYRMFPDVFLKLCKLIRDTTHLKDTRFICVEEMVATFLITVGQNSRYCHTIDTFKRSKFATSTNFHKVLRAINTIAPSLMAKPNLVVASKIRESTRFYPYFKVYVFSLYFSFSLLVCFVKIISLIYFRIVWEQLMVHTYLLWYLTVKLLATVIEKE